ncbi:MAG: sigma 54-interacting transcriptional regulator [Deltaproteobacteria bacterium]|nr:sigma 54-interacting transcriptional regulator [Deltaproteobacteria bacterium]
MRWGGRYEVLEKLGEEVYLVSDRHADEPAEVVLKEVVGGGDRTREALAREFRTLVGLRHPGIVRVLDFGAEPGGATWLTTEKVEGETLDRVLPGLRPEVVRALLIQAVDALAWAHRHGVLHGDLKPANAMCALAPAPRLVLLDFGLARAVAGEQRAAGGTPGWVAPELAAGGRPTVASDLYGLGAAFFGALVGETPGLVPATRLAQRARLPETLAPLLEALLEPDPALRPVDAEAVLRRLGARPTAGTAAPPFVGRKADLDLLCRRSPGAILLHGPLGSGRSRLLGEARWRLQLEGRPVLELARAPEPDAGDLSATAAPVLLDDDFDRHPPERQSLLARRAAAWIRNRRAGVLLAAEDEAALARLSSDLPALESLVLGPLDRAALGALVAASLGRPDEALAERLFERSGGVPQFAVDLLQGVGACTEAGEIDAACVALSADGAAAVRARLAGLPRRARELAGLLAALGREAAATELRALEQDIDDEAFPALRHAGLAVECAGRWALAVPAAAEAILGPAAPQAHRRLAEKLRRAGADEAELDRQRAQAGEPDAALRAARRAMESGAAREALALLGPAGAAIFAAAEARPTRVLEWADVAAAAGEHAAVRRQLEPLATHAEPEVRGRALLRLGEALERLGELRAAGERLTAALATLDRPAELATARLRLARLALLAGDPAAARDHARAGLAGDGGEQAGLRLQLGAALARLGDAAAAREELSVARATAQAKGDPRTAAAALGHLAMVCTADGDAVQARELYLRALAEAETAQDVAALPAHLLNLATVHRTLRDQGAALELLRRAEALARRLGRTGPLAAALINLANLYVEVGAAAEARAAAQEAAELAGRAGVPAVAAQAELVLAEALAWTDPAEARRHAAGARTGFAALGDGGRAAEAAVVEGELALALGEPDAVREALAASEADAPPGLQARRTLLEGNLARAVGSPSAVERLEAALAGAAAAGDEDLAARAELALGDLLEEVGSPLAAERRRRAAERLSGAALRLPPALREAFWSVPHRARAREAAAATGPAGAPGRGSAEPAMRLLALAPGMLAERDTQRVLERALDAGLDVLGGERGFLLLRDGSDWRVAAARNIDRESIRRAAFKFSRSVAEQVADTGEPVLTASAVDDPRFAAARSVHQLALQSIVCVPIRSPDRVLGTIYVENRFSRGRFDAGHLRLAQALADQVALALEAGRLERELHERAEELERARAELARRVEVQEDELARLEREVRRSREGTTLRHEYAGIVGRGPAMRRLLATLDRVAETSLPVLIEGATGTGKELVARALHDHGPRRGRPFLSVNCGALPDLLLESELFGHARGAFTGADRARPGLMREASGGTLFLDEVGETSPAMQVKLLRALQNAEVTPLGIDHAVPVDVRIVAATNRDLARRTAEGRFREDLFYRLNVVRLRVPSLAERREDIPELAAHFLARLAPQTGGTPKRLGRAALRALVRHDFPGNVRELENLLATAAVFASGEELRPEDLPLPAAASTAAAAGGSRREQLRAADRLLVGQTLRACAYNLSEAARRLGISRPTLYHRLREYGLERRATT